MSSLSLGICGACWSKGGVCWRPKLNIRRSAVNSRLTLELHSPSALRAATYSAIRAELMWETLSPPNALANRFAYRRACRGDFLPWISKF